MRPFIFLVSALAVADCNVGAGFDSDRGQVHFYDADLWRSLLPGETAFDNGVPLVEGTRFCPDLSPSVREWENPETGVREKVELPQEYLDCFEIEIDGPVQEEEAGDDDGEWGDDEGEGQAPGCVYLLGSGEVRYEFEPRPCDWSGDEDFAPVEDEAGIEVAAAGSVTARLEPIAEEMAEAWYSPGEGHSWPEDDRPGAGGRIGVVAGERVAFPVVLEDPDGRRVALPWGGLVEGDGPVPDLWQGWLRIEATLGEAPQIAMDEPGRFGLVPAPDSEVALTLSAGDAEWTVAIMQTVAAAQAASMHLVVAWSGTPAAARAVVRTADGMLVFGVPIEWEAAGPLLLSDATEAWGDAYFPGGDYTLLEVDEQQLAQSDQPQEVEATVTARWGDLEASADLRWTQQPTAPRTDADGRGDGVPPIDDGCGCDGPPPLSPLFLALPGVVALRRRKW